MGSFKKSALLAAIAFGMASGASAQVNILNADIINAPPVYTGVYMESPTTGDINLTLTGEGDVILRGPAVVDYSTVLPRAGICVGFVPIRVQGDLMLMPVYLPVPGDKLPPQFKETKPANAYKRVASCELNFRH